MPRGVSVIINATQLNYLINFTARLIEIDKYFSMMEMWLFDDRKGENEN